MIQTKLFSDLYLAKFLDTSAKLFFPYRFLIIFRAIFRKSHDLIRHKVIFSVNCNQIPNFIRKILRLMPCVTQAGKTDIFHLARGKLWSLFSLRRLYLRLL